MSVNYKVIYQVKTINYKEDNVNQEELEFKTSSNDYSEIFTDIYLIHRNSTLKGIEILTINED